MRFLPYCPWGIGDYVGLRNAPSGGGGGATRTPRVGPRRRRRQRVGDRSVEKERGHRASLHRRGRETKGGLDLVLVWVRTNPDRVTLVRRPPVGQWAPVRPGQIEDQLPG
jgi:hypothetical protein